ncbi:MAG: hypothetical protein DWH78_06200 [Planctomycetota bacterium]|nr:MAG: hypothetical protein DWH78_06200 [Planctomycetota bacterium]
MRPSEAFPLPGVEVRASLEVAAGRTAAGRFDVVAGLAGGAAEVLCESLETGRALRTAGRFSELPASVVEVDAAADEGPVPGPVSAVWGTSTTPEHEGHRIFLPATLSGTFNVFLQWAHWTNMFVRRC